MSMTILTVLQILAVFTAYMVVTCVVPLVIVNRILPKLRIAEKLLLSVVFGNFYIINEVFVLELLHISNRWTLIAGTVLPFAAAAIRIYHIRVKEKAKSILQTFQKLVEGELGQKSLMLRQRKKGGALFIRFMKRVWGYLFRHPLDVLLFLGVTALVLWQYMPNLLENYGYQAFDMPVHNYWINAMGENNLFVAGVYPFGFHCMIYYLHAVFGIETYVILRVFSLVQTLMIHWMLLLFLKVCLKSGYLAYIGTAVFAGANLFRLNSYYRYGATLPQEFGMIFILPAVYFGFAYFKSRKKWCLAGFAMSFSLTLAIHFYGTMIAGIFCVAMALGFGFRFFRKKYVVPIITTCLISVLIAVAPMAIAYAAGTPLQGSMGWAINIISGNSESTEISNDVESEVTENDSSEADDYRMDMDGSPEEEIQEDTGTVISEEISKTQNVREQICQRVLGLEQIIRTNLMYSVFDTENIYCVWSIYFSIGLCVLNAILYIFLREFEQTGRLLTIVFFEIILTVMLAAGDLGLPTLMEARRVCIYYAYMLPVLWCFAADAVLYLPGRLFRKRWIYQLASFALVVAAVVCCVNWDLVRTPYQSSALETNGAITCLTNIMKEHEDETWTVCSANDELRMVEDYGYHYELITFLRRIENIGRYSGLTIPTKYTYFFVEKVPIEYYVTYDGQGQSISEEGAMRELPSGTGITPYEGEDRWIVMSRMYYWCEAFREMYPENMTVYYETEDFICYQLEQNIDHLFELGIDYGYNNFYQ
jgi:hypothetical protein